MLFIAFVAVIGLHKTGIYRFDFLKDIYKKIDFQLSTNELNIPQEDVYKRQLHDALPPRRVELHHAGAGYDLQGGRGRHRENACLLYTSMVTAMRSIVLSSSSGTLSPAAMRSSSARIARCV